jgi:hypothetical protein
MIVAIADTALRSGIFSDRQGRTYRRFGHQPRRDVYLIEKGRIPANALNDLHAAIADSKAVLQHVPLDENFAMKMRESPARTFPIFPTASLRRRLNCVAYLFEPRLSNKIINHPNDLVTGTRPFEAICREH